MAYDLTDEQIQEANSLSSLQYIALNRPIVEAFQLTAERLEHSNADWPHWLHEAWNRPRSSYDSLTPLFLPREDLGGGKSKPGARLIQLMTRKGHVTVNPNDWIIRDQDGYLSVVSDQEFYLNYFRVESALGHELCQQSVSPPAADTTSDPCLNSSSPNDHLEVSTTFSMGRPELTVSDGPTQNKQPSE